MASTDLDIMNERAQHLLKTLVRLYIRDGQPVGSRTLSRDSDIELSPATIRNVMADLEDMGLIMSPHTSAGRIPTARGYRLFVDSLIKIEPLSSEEISQIRSRFNHGLQSDSNALSNTSNVLSEITHMAGIVMLPRYEYQALRHVEFLPLSEQRVLVVLVVNEQQVQNHIIHTSREYSASELQQAANYLNEAFVGRDIRELRAHIVNDMREAREAVNQMMEAVVEVASKAFTPPTTGNDGDFVVAGQTNLMASAEAAKFETLRELFSAFNQKRDILHLLDEALSARDMRIFIGEETGYHILDEYSVVTSPYEVNGQVIGVLGVIGPTRMAYDRVIPIVDITAKLLSAALQ